VRRRAKVDLNHTEVVNALRAAGCTVQSLAEVGDGCPDLLVGYRGTTWLLEVKSPGGSVTEDQVQWLARWRGGCTRVVYSPEQALAVVGARRDAP
jgi:hypothetical protein